MCPRIHQTLVPPDSDVAGYNPFVKYQQDIPITLNFVYTGWFQPNLKKIRPNGSIFPQVVKGENRNYVSCHHLVKNLVVFPWVI